MRFEKISDDVNMDLVDEEELKKLDGEYDVQWFITAINSTERTLRAKDKLILSNGVGVFLGNEPNKQPSFELRKELSIQYNANGEIIILGKIDLMEKMDVKKWYASGKIHPMKKSKLKTIWGFSDVIELEIEKSKISEIPKVKEIKAEKLIYGDDFIFDKKNNSFQLKRLDEIIKINQNDFSLNFDSNDEKFFDGDISYTTSANNFGTTWIGLKVKKIEEVSHNIKIAFQIEEGSFPNFPEAFSISKNENGGSIVNISSDLGLIAPDQRLYHIAGLNENLQPVKPITYSIVKTGVIGITRYVSTYWANKNVRCNAICPGGVENNQNPNFISEVIKRIPMNRMANKNEYQGILVFLH